MLCHDVLVVRGGVVVGIVWLYSRNSGFGYDISLIWVCRVLLWLLVILAMLAMAIREAGRVICAVDLPLVMRRRDLTRVVHIVRSSIVVRQRGLYAWVPPERAALNGRRSVDGNNVRYGAPEKGDLERDVGEVDGAELKRRLRREKVKERQKSLFSRGKRNKRRGREKRDLATLPCLARCGYRARVDGG